MMPKPITQQPIKAPQTPAGGLGSAQPPQQPPQSPQSPQPPTTRTHGQPGGSGGAAPSPFPQPPQQPPSVNTNQMGGGFGQPGGGMSQPPTAPQNPWGGWQPGQVPRSNPGGVSDYDMAAGQRQDDQYRQQRQADRQENNRQSLENRQGRQMQRFRDLFSQRMQQQGGGWDWGNNNRQLSPEDILRINEKRMGGSLEHRLANRGLPEGVALGPMGSSNLPPPGRFNPDAVPDFMRNGLGLPPRGVDGFHPNV